MSGLLSDAKNIFIGDENKIAKPIAKFSPLGFTTPGASVSTGPGGFTVGRSPQVGNALSNLNNLSTGAASDLGALRPMLAPGFGRMTTEGVRAIEDQRRSTVGNLRENLGRRRVLGSSFASDDISRTNAEFAKKDAQFRAETTLQEIQATEQLITKQYETAIQGSQAIIAQGNFETKIGAELSRQYTSVMGELAKFEAALLRDEADGQSALLSSLLNAGLGGAFEGFGGVVGDLLDNLGGVITGVAGGLGLDNLFSSSASSAVATGVPSGVVATGVPGFNDLSSIPMTPLAPDGIPQATGALSGAPLHSGEISLGGATGGGAGDPATGTAPLSPGTAALYSGGIVGAMSLIQGEGLGMAATKGLTAASGAALGAKLGAGFGPWGAAGGAILGGFFGSFAGGKLGKSLGLSRGGGEDKPDYSLGSGDNLSGKQLTSNGVWGTVGFGHFKHLTGGERYQSALDVVTETDNLISAGLTPEENEKVKEAFKHNFIGQNSNEGGFTPARMMNQVFANRAATLERVLGKERYEGLGINEIYNVLRSGDQAQIEAVFGGAA